MDNSILVEVRRLVLSGEEVPRDLLRRALMSLRDSRSTSSPSSVKKRKGSEAVSQEEAAALLDKLLQE